MTDKIENPEIKNPNENRLHLEMENGKPVLKNKVGNVEITISFAEKEPERNCKEACLGIIARQYEDRLLRPDDKTK